MSSSVMIRSATIEDARPISELLTALAEEFIVGDFPVAKASQRTGLARRLWEVARDDAIRAGNSSGRFTVNASRTAVPAYERLDFRCLGPVQQANGVRYQPMEWVSGA